MNRLLSSGGVTAKNITSRSLRFPSSYRFNSSTGFKAALTAGEKLINPKAPLIDPISIVSHEMSSLAKNIASLISSGHPTLNKAGAYYFEADGKRLRPLIVLLLSKALSAIPIEERNRLKPDHFDTTDQPEYRGVTSSSNPRVDNVVNGSPDESLSPLNILHGINPSLILAPLSKAFDPLPDTGEVNGILPKQRRLAEIVEMIHTASLLHDDVIDHSNTRRGRDSGNVAFTNKMAVLAGDFLLGRASVAIARIRNPEVIELISTSIANLVEGEFMQLKNTIVSRDPNTLEDGKILPKPTGKIPSPGHNYTVALPNDKSIAITHDLQWDGAFQYYLHKTYLKTAALISKSSRSAAVLSGAQEDVIEHCYQFGRNLGIAFQLVDDVLDFTRSSEELGKPAGADLKLGLATGPVLYAWKQQPNLGPIIARKFSEQGDIEYSVECVEKYNGVKQTQELAEEYKNKALEHLRVLPESDARAALEFITSTVTTRSK